MRIHRLRTIFLVFLLTLSSLFAEWGEYEFDGKPNGVIAIGDIHADSEAFVDALVGNGILDENGKFIAQGKDIVFLGDFTDKGPNTLAVWDIMEHIRREAEKNNSRVHSLFGNHDTVVLMGELKRMYPEDQEKFIKRFNAIFKRNPTELELASPLRAVEHALISEPYRNLMQQWRTMIKIDDTLYIHGGVDNWVLDTTPEEINNTVNAYVKDQQNYLERKLAGTNSIPPRVPDVLEPWTFDSPNPFPDNPFWSRELSKGNVKPEDFKKILKSLGVKRVVVGHTPTKSKKIESMYKRRLFRVDTNISRGFKNGTISGLHLTKNGKVKKRDNLPRGTTKAIHDGILYRFRKSCFSRSLLR